MALIFEQIPSQKLGDVSYLIGDDSARIRVPAQRAVAITGGVTRLPVKIWCWMFGPHRNGRKDTSAAPAHLTAQAIWSAWNPGPIEVNR